MPSFRDYEEKAEEWITPVESGYFPNHIEIAEEKYEPIINKFERLLRRSKSSVHLFKLINKESGKERVQLLRIFRRYISPDTSVEMLKVKKKEDMIIRRFGDNFRDIESVKRIFRDQCEPDRALIALLDEYADRGQKGYDTQEYFFDWIEDNFGNEFRIEGPRRAGSDIYLSEVLDKFPNPRPVDFVIFGPDDNPQVVGLIRYDSDRGGAQEDDRPSGYRGLVREITAYCRKESKNIKILFINEGPGLLLGSMWDDYSKIDEMGDYVKVCTLDMLEERLDRNWFLLKWCESWALGQN